MSEVENRRRKWGMMVGALPASKHDMTAWVIEEEVRALQRRVDAGEVEVAGHARVAKVLLPAVRAICDAVIQDSAVDRLARLTQWPLSLTVEEVETAAREALGSYGSQDHTYFDREVEALAIRVHQAILAFPAEAGS